MRTLSQIHQAYEEIIHALEREPSRSRSLAKLMEEMEKDYPKSLLYEMQPGRARTGLS